MVDWPRNPAEETWARNFLASRDVWVADTAHYIFWRADPRYPPVWVVAFDDWLGKTCQLHVATDRARLVPRKLARVVFDYAFNMLGKEMIFALVNSNNLPALRLDQWLGFETAIEFPKMFDDSGDIVVLTMKRAGCRWLKEPHVQIPTAAA